VWEGQWQVDIDSFIIKIAFLGTHALRMHNNPDMDHRPRNRKDWDFPIILHGQIKTNEIPKRNGGKKDK
jgi:hypothetical protein